MRRPSKDEYYLDIALSVSKRSNCLKRHYGVVIVKDDIIVATGYNGSPRGYENCCDSGICNRMEIPHNSGNYSDCPSVHAEQNALIQCSQENLKDATMYISGEEELDYFKMREIKDASPCPICSRMIANSGIKTIVNRFGRSETKCLQLR